MWNKLKIIKNQRGMEHNMRNILPLTNYKGKTNSKLQWKIGTINVTNH